MKKYDFIFPLFSFDAGVYEFEKNIYWKHGRSTRFNASWH
jgi:hypothetical protein